MAFNNLCFGIITLLLFDPSAFVEATKCDCGGEVTDVSSGEITSPCYPQRYPKNLDCTWKIVSTKGNPIQINIDFLDIKETSLSGSKGRCYDTLTIFQSFPFRRSFSLCGSSIADLDETNFEFQSYSSIPTTVVIHFTSDYSTQLGGFSIDYHIVGEETTIAEATTPTVTTLSTKRTSTSWPSTFKSRRPTTSVPSSVFASRSTSLDDSIEKTEDKRLDSHKENFRSVPEQLRTEGYHGNCSTTREGFTCQRWDMLYPHEPYYIPSDPHHNFCRALRDNSEWCYTNDPGKRWDFCDVVSCDLQIGTPYSDSEENSSTVTTALRPGKSTDQHSTGNIYSASSTAAAPGQELVSNSIGFRSLAVIFGSCLLGVALLCVILLLLRRHKKKRVTIESNSATVLFRNLSPANETRRNTYGEVGTSCNGMNLESNERKRSIESSISFSRWVATVLADRVFNELWSYKKRVENHNGLNKLEMKINFQFLNTLVLLDIVIFHTENFL